MCGIEFDLQDEESTFEFRFELFLLSFWGLDSWSQHCMASCPSPIGCCRPWSGVPRRPGHFPMVDNPKQIVEIVENFFLCSQTFEKELAFWFASGYQETNVYLYGIFVGEFVLRLLFSSQRPSFASVSLFWISRASSHNQWLSSGGDPDPLLGTWDPYKVLDVDVGNPLFDTPDLTKCIYKQEPFWTLFYYFQPPMHFAAAQQVALKSHLEYL